MPGTYVVQALLFPVTDFAPATARAWARRHGYAAGPLVKLVNYYEIAQIPADRLDHDTFRTLRFGPVLARTARALVAFDRPSIPWKQLSDDEVREVAAAAGAAGDVALVQRARRALADRR